MQDSLPNEHELWRHCAAGDEMAFTRLFYHYNRVIYPFVLKKVKSEAIAEEIIQDTFLRLWTSRETIAEMASPAGYLYRIAANRTLDYLRKLSREQNFLDRYTGRTEEPENVEESIYYNETRKAVEEAVRQLPAQRRNIYLLRQEGYSYLEIAEKLQLSPNTVRNQLVSAMQSIRTFVQEKGISILVLFSLWRNL